MRVQGSLRRRSALFSVTAACIAAMTLVTATAASGAGTDIRRGNMTEAQAAALVMTQLGPIKQATGNTTRGINGKTITLGGVATIIGPSGAEQFPGLCEATQARLARANRTGGVNGYKFKYNGCRDDHFDPTKDRQAVRDAVETDKDFALLPYVSFLTDPTYPSAKHVPYFGFGLGAGYCGWNKAQFGFSTTSAESCLGTLKNGSSLFSDLALSGYLKASGKKAGDVKVALISSQDATAAKAVNAFKILGTAMGMKIAYAETALPANGQPPLTDYSPVASAIISSGATFTMEIVGDIGQLVGVSSALKSQGYKGDLMNFQLSDKRILAVSSVTEPNDGSYVLMPQSGAGLVYPSPTFHQIQADLNAIGKKSIDGNGLGAQYGYAAADLFLSALKKVKGKLTTEKLAGVLNSGFQYPGLGNSVCPITFPAAHVMPSPCSAIVILDAKNKTFKKALDLGIYGKIFQLGIS